jgi:receptor protein-tyrosine kinase
MNLIEQAARRLEELRRSGVELPVLAQAKTASASARLGPASSRAALAEAVLPARPIEADPPARAVRIDLARLAALGYITPQQPRTQIANEFRIVKRPLLGNVYGQAAPVERANLIMVTSSMPAEGKTFVALNLAISIALELDRTVLLVDADVSRPSVLERLGLPPSPGLLDVATGSCRFGDALLRTNIDRLTILPAGTRSDNATELLASAQTARLVTEMARRYADRILIFDAPPLLVSTESRVLASHMGQVVLVVEAERTSHQTVLNALSKIESCPVVLPLLNKTSRPEVGNYDGYDGSATGSA